MFTVVRLLANSNPTTSSYLIVGVKDAIRTITGTHYLDDQRIQTLVHHHFDPVPALVYENVHHAMNSTFTAARAASSEETDLVGGELGFQKGVGRVHHTKLAFGQQTLAPRSRSGRSSSIWPFDTSTEPAIR